MFSKLVTAASLLLVARGAAAITISTPDYVPQCGEITFNINEANGPVYFSVVPGVNPCASDALFESGQISGGDYKWTAKAEVGSTWFAYVDDNSEQEGWSRTFTVVEGNNACLTAASASSSSVSASVSASTSSTRTVLTVNPTPRPGADDEDEAQQDGGDYSGVGNAIDGVETNGAFSSASVSLSAVLAVAGLVAFTL